MLYSLSRQMLPKLAPPAQPLNRSDLLTHWNFYLSNINISTSVAHPGMTDDASEKALTLTIISEKYPPESWKHTRLSNCRYER